MLRNVRVGAASRSAFLASIGFAPPATWAAISLARLRAASSVSCGIGADGRAQRLAAVWVAEAIGERASVVRGDSQHEPGLPQIRDLKPAASAASSGKGHRSESGARPPPSRMPGLGDAQGTQLTRSATEPSRTRRHWKSIINRRFQGASPFRPGPLKYIRTRLRIWGSGVRIPPSAPFKPSRESRL